MKYSTMSVSMETKLLANQLLAKWSQDLGRLISWDEFVLLLLRQANDVDVRLIADRELA